MEAKDSPASPSAAAALAGTTDGPANDEGNLSDAKGLAKEAAFLFQNRRFQECVEVLSQIFDKKRGDAKVLHNIAVAEYFRDGCTDPRNLLDALNKVKEQSEELAHTCVNQTDSENSCLGYMVSGSKANSASIHQSAAINSSRVVYAQEFDVSVTMLNIAIILYHIHEYAQSLSVLKKLFQNIEPIEEQIALRVCLLLLDVALACEDILQVSDVIQYLEKSLGIARAIGQLDSGSSTQQQSNQVLKFSITSNVTAPDASTDSTNGNASENALGRTLPDESLEYETLYSTLDTGSENMERPISNDNLMLSPDQEASAIDLKLNLHLYKVQLLLLARNPKAAKREIKLAMNIARFRDSSTTLLLKSQLEYARGNHRKAIKLLTTTSNNRSDQGMLCMFNNNMGCIYQQLGKYHISSLFFSKALKCNAAIQSEKSLKLSTFSQEKSLFILYNCGLQYLLCGRPLVAAQCFDKSKPIFYTRPILWLRFAECCLSVLEKGLLGKCGSSSSEGEVVKVHVAGSGKWRHLVIDDLSSTNRYRKCSGEDGVVIPDGKLRLTLPFARRCLLNALYLLDCTEKSQPTATLSSQEESNQPTSASAKYMSQKNAVTSDSKASNVASASIPTTNGELRETKGGTLSNMTLQSSISLPEEMCRKERNMIRQAVLANLAYVELSLGNPVRALSAAKEILQLPDCSKMYIFLGHVYAAEALCCLNRVREAVEHLSIYVSEKNEVQLPYSEEDTEKWRIDKSGDAYEYAGTHNGKSAEVQGMIFLKPEAARGALYVNLAALAAIQGNAEQADMFVNKALSALPDNHRAVLGAIYVDLLLRRTHNAVVKLRQCRHVRFFPAHLTSSS
ncbi:CCR4-NOT transcription complex subunit 10-like isoform X1 [Zingiber officinale]|uniref:CCR4-NOT transcription complex subunit 10-like isoform X1 n=1 Tax=Zingiber officinale TaxID=94328 RepID=UPI001C4AD99B|nr:CCR4-NOT transcription complex subunit 10-like isoform X1 [Zingiber officinale]